MPYIAANNQRIFYRHNDFNADLPTLVMVHGAGGRSQSWPYQWQQSRFVRSRGKPRWVTDFPLYFVDLPGHGQSDPPGKDNIEAYAADILAFMETLDLQRVVLIGHSMGGAIVQQVALTQSPRIAGLVLIGTGAFMPVTDMILQGLRTEFAETVHLINKFSWRKQSAPGSKEVAVQHMLSTDPKIVHDDFLACSQFDVRDRLAEIVVPTLVVGGSDDKMMPLKQSERLAEGIRLAELLVIEDAGHYMMVDKTSRVSRGLVQFLNNLG